MIIRHYHNASKHQKAINLNEKEIPGEKNYGIRAQY